MAAIEEEVDPNKVVESCTGLRSELLKCLRESDCVTKVIEIHNL